MFRSQKKPVAKKGRRSLPTELALWARAANKAAPEESPEATRRVLSRKRVIGLFRSIVLTFDSREKVVDRIVADSVPGLFGLAQVASSGPPAQLSTDLPG
jgi:hypothetical protein